MPPPEPELGEAESGLGAGQRDRGGRLVHVGQLLLQQVCRPAAGFLGTRFIDVIGPLGGIRKDSDLVGPHFQESAGDEKELFLVVVAHLDYPRPERG